MISVTHSDVLALLAAIALAALGGAGFLNGMLGVAAWLRLPNILVATTLAAFATSGPEMAVSSMAALAGKPGIGLGDALGSNVVNVGLILGMALLFRPWEARLHESRRDFGLALAVPALTLALALDGILSRADGILLLVLFAAWATLVTRQAIAHRRDRRVPAGPEMGGARAWILLLAGLVALILAGRLFVSGASGIATAMGLHPYIVGATVVAFGTSLPELVTVVLSRLRGHDDVGLGTVLGSNLFNGLAVAGVAATIHPIFVSRAEVGVAVVFGVLTVLLLIPVTGRIPRRRGPLLIAAYGVFFFMTAVGG